MQNYDTSKIQLELQKEISGHENELKVEVAKMIARFNEYQNLVREYEALNAVTKPQIDKLTSSVESMTKVIAMIKEILYCEASPEAIVKLLKEQIK